MPRATTNSRPNKTLTDFFSKKPKTGPRLDQPIYDVSSSSERQSIMSISSDEVPVPVTMSQPVQSSRVRAGTTRASSRTRGGAYLKEQSSIYSRLSETHTPTPSRMSSPNPTDAFSLPKKNAKKRKKEPINLISSEESDGPKFPSIHMKLSPKKNKRDSTRCISPILPLTPRQNLLNPPKQPSDLDALPSSSSLKPLTQQLKNGTSNVPAHHRSSASKRARHDSAEKPILEPSARGFDAEDDNEDKVDGPSISLDRKSAQSAHCPQQSEGDSVVIIDGDMHMNVDSAISRSNLASICGVTEGDGGKDLLEKSDGGTDALTGPSGSNGHHHQEIQEVLPSSQQGEIELLMDSSRMSIDEGNVSENTFIPPLPPVSPSKARTDSIIARIKAKAEADASVQAPDDRRRSFLGHLGSDNSDLSSLSSISSDEDEDEAELELELGTFERVNSVKDTDFSMRSADVRSVTSLKFGTRRSTRHVDLPAPNYAKKLELFRDSTLPPSGKGRSNVNGKVNNKEKVPEACPLDMLLKDREREGARKAYAETKRKRTVPNSFGFDPASDHGCSVSETPKCGHRPARTESPGSDISSQNGNIFQDALMGTATHEELLGKEGAKAVEKILDSDRKKKTVIKEIENEVFFWCEPIMEDGIDVVPQLETSHSSPILTALTDVLNRKDYAVASLLVESGALASVPLSVELLNWLFATAMSTASHDISLSAYRALMVLHHEVYSTEVMTCAQLNSIKLLVALFKFGVNTHVAQLLGVVEDDMVSLAGISPELKEEKLCRFLSMLEVLGRSQRIDLMAMPSIVTALLLLSLDRSTVPELRQQAVSAIEAILVGINVTRIVELEICKFILHVTKALSFTPELQVRLLALLPGCSLSSGRVRRWTAWAMLGGDLKSIQECANVPSIKSMIGLFSKTTPGVVKLEVSSNTDYERLGAMVNILSVVMTDVDAYVRLPNGSSLTKCLYDALERLNGKIVDTRVAHIDRTRTKEAINRLHKRLVYQRHATLDLMCTWTGKMDQFLVAKPKSLKPKSEENNIKDA